MWVQGLVKEKGAGDPSFCWVQEAALHSFIQALFWWGTRCVPGTREGTSVCWIIEVICWGENDTVSDTDYLPRWLRLHGFTEHLLWARCGVRWCLLHRCCSLELNHLPFLSQTFSGTSRESQWIRLCASTTGGAGSIPGRRTKIRHAGWPKN